MQLVIFAQSAGEPPVELDPEAYPIGHEPFIWHVLSWFSYPFSLLSVAFTIWMLVDCIRKEPDRYFWFWIIIFLAPPIGPAIYFFMRWIPHNEVQPPKFLRQWTRGRELRRLEIAAEQIGNPHQFIQLGDARRETGHLSQADAAYRQALEKDPKNLQALWGAALVDMRLKNFTSAREHLEAALKIDPQYKFGDVSMAYGRTLYELGQTDDAENHLQNHVKRWRHPEALFLCATIQSKRGEVETARLYLRELLQDINACPKAIARKFGRWRSKAKRMLRSLPKS